MKGIMNIFCFYIGLRMGLEGLKIVNLYRVIELV